MDARDRPYFLSRLRQEEEAARVATCAQARERHLELAEAYRLRCGLLSSPPRHTCLVDDELRLDSVS